MMAALEVCFLFFPSSVMLLCSSRLELPLQEGVIAMHRLGGHGVHGGAGGVGRGQQGHR